MFSTASRMPPSSLAHRDPVDEVAGVLALPAERRVQHHGVGPELVGQLIERSIFSHGSVPQTRCVTSRVGACTDSTGMPCSSDERAQRAGLAGERVGPDHHLDAVVAEAGGELEGGGDALGVDRGGRQARPGRAARRPVAPDPPRAPRASARLSSSCPGGAG